MQPRLEASITFWACVISLNIVINTQAAPHLVWAWLILTLFAWIGYLRS